MEYSFSVETYKHGYKSKNLLYIEEEKIVCSKCSLYSPIKHRDIGDNDDGYYVHRVGDDDHVDNDDSNL